MEMKKIIRLILKSKFAIAIKVLNTIQTEIY